MKQQGFRYCSACHSKLQKWGKTAADTQRWRCASCVSTQVHRRPDLSRAFLLERFVTWLLGKQSQAELRGSDRTWRRQIAWCWQVIPRSELTGEIYPIIILDGIRVGHLVCLIARTPEAVIAWHWVGWEASTTWSELLSKIPAPSVVVCDGQKGILLAIAHCWPNTRVQRCIFHVWQNIRSKLTLNPQTIAGQELLQLVRGLWQVEAIEHALIWQQALEAWTGRHAAFIKERTYLANPVAGQRRWWYTHRGLRSASLQLLKLLKNNQLFTYLDTAIVSEPIPRTTNHVEGGINSQLRTKLKHHRGLNQLHQQRLVDWYLHSRTQHQKPTRNGL